MFDTLAYSQHLQDAGVDRKQADAQASAMTKFIIPDLATSAQVAASEASVKLYIDAKIAAIDAKIAASVDAITWRLIPATLAIVGIADGLLLAVFRH